MKTKIVIAVFYTMGLVRFAQAAEKPISNLSFTIILAELEQEIAQIKASYFLEIRTLRLAIKEVRLKLKKTEDTQLLITLILEKDRLSEMLRTTQKSEMADISKIRYLKGLQIIKLIYEKILALDHHFESITTFNEISAMSNPNQYAEFKTIKNTLQEKSDKRSGFNLPEILGNNIYTSVVHSIVSLFNTNNSKTEKQAALKEMECILDFTLSMHNDLSTIFFETSYLKSSNQNIMKAAKTLFAAYTKPIAYNTPLEQCRNTDDWDSIKTKLEVYLQDLKEVLHVPEKADQAFKLQVNLEFTIDRLLQFISQYNNFIDQGEKFYQKFAIMLDSYQNQELCAGQIPDDFYKLKTKVSSSITKFNTAYKPVEINGSKLKEVLYGINEFD